MKALVQAIFACFSLVVLTYIEMVARAIFGVLMFQLACVLTSVSLPIECINILLPALGFSKVLQPNKPNSAEPEVEVQVGCCQLLAIAASCIGRMLVVTITR